MTAIKKERLKSKGAGKPRQEKEGLYEYVPISSYGGRHIISQSPGSVDPVGSTVIGKEILSRVWETVKSDWGAWKGRSLAKDSIDRIMLDSAQVPVQLDCKATSIALLVVMGIRASGKAMLLTVAGMGGETQEDWRSVLDDLVTRGLRRPHCLILGGAPGLEKAVATASNGVPVQRCTDQALRKLLAPAPERLHSEITSDYNDMIFAYEMKDIPARRKSFFAKWRRRCRPAADALEKVGDDLFTFSRLPPLPRDNRDNFHTTYAIKSLHDGFKRRINSQTVLPSADTAAMLFASTGVLDELIETMRGADRYCDGDWPTRMGLLWQCIKIIEGGKRHD
jgi:putative transposase